MKRLDFIASTTRMHTHRHMDTYTHIHKHRNPPSPQIPWIQKLVNIEKKNLLFILSVGKDTANQYERVLNL